MTSTGEVHGFVAPGFEAVRAEFARNLSSRNELGAACSAFVGGRPVVDLWGGVRDVTTGKPWERDTLVVAYSTSKGLAAMTLTLLHSRQLLDYDERVSTYWPDFGQAGKGDVTVRQLLAHQAGLPVVDKPLDARLLADFDRLAATVARQRPLWEPGTRHGYHGLSLGWYEGELVRRIDPEHRSLGRFFAEEIASPLELDAHFGLPRETPKDRLARIEHISPGRAILGVRRLPPRMARALSNPRSLTARTFANPRLRTPSHLDSSRYRHVEFPSGGAITNARSVAQAYAAFSGTDPRLGIAPATLNEITGPAPPPTHGPRDMVLKVDTVFSLGFARPSPGIPFGSTSRAFGHPGAGGSFAFADPDRELSFAYLMNRMGFRLSDDPREKALRDAVYRCVDSSAPLSASADPPVARGSHAPGPHLGP